MLQLLLAALLALAAMRGANPNPIPIQCVSAETLQERLSADLPQARVLPVPVLERLMRVIAVEP